MNKTKIIYIKITPEHADEILDGCMGLGSYSPEPYSSIDKNKYRFVKKIKTIYKDMEFKIDADIIGWECEVEILDEKD